MKVHLQPPDLMCLAERHVPCGEADSSARNTACAVQGGGNALVLDCGREMGSDSAWVSDGVKGFRGDDLLASTSSSVRQTNREHDIAALPCSPRLSRMVCQRAVVLEVLPVAGRARKGSNVKSSCA